MSLELENVIKEDLFRQRIYNLIIRYKKLLIFFFICLILFPSCYAIYLDYEFKKNSKLLEDYSQAVLLKKNNEVNRSIEIFERLLKNKENENIKLLALNELIQIYIEEKKINKAISIIDKLILDKKISRDKINLIKIKKSLLIFDVANEKQILSLLDVRNDNNLYKNIYLKILSDFYKSKNNENKYKEYLNEIKQ